MAFDLKDTKMSLKKIAIFALSIRTDKHWWENNENLDQIVQNAKSDQVLLCLPLIQQWSDSLTSSNMDLFKF